MELFDDIELLSMLQNNNMEALNELYNRYWEVLFDIACKKLNDREDAKDIVHDLFLQLWNTRTSLYIYKSFSGFLFTALKNKIIDKQRSVTRRTKKDNEIVQMQPGACNGTYEEVCYNELNGIIRFEIDQLPEKMREIYQLSREENLSIDEIANRLSLSNQTVKNQISKALKRLREKVSQSLATIFF
ncbi:RNA polymerase sigma factor [Solitalea lacus]|uniref:RNA polymerase sigma factor n=1 Tax=Solitalea lacus TaxID=2911172 RepID=UPI001EDC8C12|nr:RNA polymerase sigma-70 factor [Solitalea lacus]UKJ07516.1 RNA polymerase sigma-70 factor [Solitalea lacus]